MVVRLLLAVCSAVLALPSGAVASELIDRDATNVKLEVSADGKALLTYRARGRTWHVLAWGAINAVAPTPSREQVKFKLDYAGGWGTYRKPVWKTFVDACRPYDGPKLHWLVTACKAPDGSYWALQSWQRLLPNVGLEPATRLQAAWELRLSHWRGELPRLQIELDWTYRRYDHLYGSFTYRGQPVYGFRSTPQGAPLDTFGRNVYLDTFNSAYGPGWKRENGFLTQNPRGNFCYAFFPGQSNGDRPAGNGEAYRATVSGPGVTPDVVWHRRAPGPYDPELDALANAEQRALAAGSALCRPN